MGERNVKRLAAKAQRQCGNWERETKAAGDWLAKETGTPKYYSDKKKKHKRARG